MHEIIFYNGFNLLVDIILVFATYKVAKGIGYRQAERDNIPFQLSTAGSKVIHRVGFYNEMVTKFT